MHRSKSLLALLAAIALASTAGPSYAQTYSFTTISDPDATGQGTWTYGISGNNVVGQYLDRDDESHGFIYNTATSTYRTIDDPAASFIGGSWASGISGSNIIGQYTDRGGAYQGYLYDNLTSTYVTLHDPSAATGTIPSGVSGNTIVGNYTDASNDSQGFLYNISTQNYTTLNAPTGGVGTTISGIDGNNVVGSYYQGAQQIGFLYNVSTSAYTTLIDPSATTTNYQGTQPMGISGNSIVGEYVDTSLLHGHGFLYNLAAQTYTTVDDPLAASSSIATGVDGSTIVGSYNQTNGQSFGFVAVLTPEPSSVVLLGLGAVGLGARVLCRRMRKPAA